MEDRAVEVLLRRAEGYAELIGNIVHAAAIDAPQDKDVLRPLRQPAQRDRDLLERLSVSVGVIDSVSSVEIGIERDMLATMNAAIARSVQHDALCGVKGVGGYVVVVSETTTPRDATEDILDEVFDLVRIDEPALEERP